MVPIRPTAGVVRNNERNTSSAARIALGCEEGIAIIQVTASLPESGSIPPSVDRAHWVESTAAVLVNRAIAQLPKQAWSENPEALATRFYEDGNVGDRAEEVTLQVERLMVGTYARWNKPDKAASRRARRDALVAAVIARKSAAIAAGAPSAWLWKCPSIAITLGG